MVFESEGTIWSSVPFFIPRGETGDKQEELVCTKEKKMILHFILFYLELFQVCKNLGFCTSTKLAEKLGIQMSQSNTFGT